MAAFQPHGLIRTPIQQQLYFRAHIANIYAGIANPKESETVALMEVILYRNIFTEPHFIVNSQQPPTPTSGRRCDLVVRYLESGYEDISTLLFAECKRTSTSQAFSLASLETQALNYCQLYLNYQKDQIFVYAATMAGAHVRLWTFEHGENGLAPLWGSNNEGDWRQYKDVRDNKAGLELEQIFGQIKWTPPGLYAGQSIDMYGTSHHADTPSYTGASGASGFQATTLGHQATTSGYQRSGSTVSYSAPSGPSTGGQYMYLPSQTNPRVQTGQNTDEPFDEEDKESHDGEEDEDEDDEDKETGGDYQIGEDAETQPTSSSAESKYHIVRVSKKTHTFKSPEYIFKNAKRKTRSTKREDWQKITYKGEPAWMYSHYITYDLPK